MDASSLVSTTSTEIKHLDLVVDTINDASVNYKVILLMMMSILTIMTDIMPLIIMIMVMVITINLWS